MIIEGLIASLFGLVILALGSIWAGGKWYSFIVDFEDIDELNEQQ